MAYTPQVYKGKIHHCSVESRSTTMLTVLEKGSTQLRQWQRNAPTTTSPNSLYFSALKVQRLLPIEPPVLRWFPVTWHESAVFPTHILHLGSHPGYINVSLSKHFILDCFYPAEGTTPPAIDWLSDKRRAVRLAFLNHFWCVMQVANSFQ